MDLQEAQKKYNGVKVEKQTIFWSKTHKGFGLKLNPNGKHKWISFASIDGKRAYRTIGSAETVPYKMALNGFLAAKHDKSIIELIERQKSEKESPTVREFAKIYIERHIIPNWKDPKDPIYRINQIVNAIGDVRIAALSKVDVERVKATSSTKASASGKLRILSNMFNKAVEFDFIKSKNNLVPVNPVSLVKMYVAPPRQVIIEEPDFRKLWESIELDRNYYASSAVLLFTLTGCRKNEILSLKWDDIVWDRGYISLKDTKNGTERQIPITDRIFKVLRGLPRENQYVFPSPRNANGHLENIVKPFSRMKERAGIPENVTIHDLRRSVSSYLQDQPGVNQKDVSAGLGHKTQITTQKHYTVVSNRKKTEVLSKMSEFYDKFMGERVIKTPHSSSPSSSSMSSDMLG